MRSLSQDFSERFPGHPESVDALVAVTDDMAVSGSSDGLVRVLSICPNKLLGAEKRTGARQRTFALQLDGLPSKVVLAHRVRLHQVSRP